MSLWEQISVGDMRLEQEWTPGDYTMLCWLTLSRSGWYSDCTSKPRGAGAVVLPGDLGAVKHGGNELDKVHAVLIPEGGGFEELVKLLGGGRGNADLLQRAPQLLDVHCALLVLVHLPEHLLPQAHQSNQERIFILQTSLCCHAIKPSHSL